MRARSISNLNADYKLDLSQSHQGRQDQGPLNVPPWEFWGPWTIPGKGPTLVARLGVTVHAPAIDGMTYVMRDFQRRVIDEGVIRKGTLVIQGDKPVFLVELSRQ